MSRQQRIAAVPAATRAIDESDDDESVVAAIESARSRSSLCEDTASPVAPSLALPAGLSAGDVLPVTSEAHQGAEGAAACATALSPSSPPLMTSADDDGLAAGESLQVAILRVLPPGRAPMCRRSIRKALDDSFVRVVGVDKDARREALRDAIAALRSSGILHRTAEKTYVRRDGEAPPPAAPQPSAPAPTPPVIVCDGAPGCTPGMRPAHRGARKSCAGASELPGASPAPSSALCAAGADDAVPGQPMCVDGGAAEAAAAVEAVVAGRGGSTAADGARDDAALSHRLASARVSALRRRAAAFEQRPGPLPAGCGTEAAVGAAGAAGAVPLPHAQARGPGHQLAVGERRISCSGGSLTHEKKRPRIDEASASPACCGAALPGAAEAEPSAAHGLADGGSDAHAPTVPAPQPPHAPLPDTRYFWYRTPDDAATVVGPFSVDTLRGWMAAEGGAYAPHLLSTPMWLEGAAEGDAQQLRNFLAQ